MHFELEITFYETAADADVPNPLPMNLGDASMADAFLIGGRYADGDAFGSDREITQVDVIGADDHGGRWVQARLFGRGYGVNLPIGASTADVLELRESD